MRCSRCRRHYHIPPLFSLDVLGLARLGVNAKAPTPTVLATVSDLGRRSHVVTFFWSRYSKTPPKQQHPPIPKLMATDMGDNDWFCTNLTETLAPKVCSVNDFSACKDQIKQQCKHQYSPCPPCVPTLTAGFSSSLQDGGQQDGGQQAPPPN